MTDHAARWNLREQTGGTMDRFAELEALLARKNQRFVCKDLGWPEPGPERFVARITHEVTPALSDEELAELRKQIPSVAQLAELYSRHGSIRLYCDTVANPSWGGCSSAFSLPTRTSGLTWRPISANGWPISARMKERSCCRTGSTTAW